MAKKSSFSSLGPGFSIPKQKNTDLLNKKHVSDRESVDLLREVDRTCIDPEQYVRKKWEVTAVYRIRPTNIVENKYKGKRLRLKEQGGNRPQQESLGFFICRDKNEACSIAKFGLKVGTSKFKHLGDPKQGIYLYRYFDVTLLSEMERGKACVLVFKVVTGKVKPFPIHMSDGQQREPTPNYDSHISHSAPLVDEPQKLIIHKSQLYLYEYTDEAIPAEYPPQCLPYAVIELKVVNAPVNPAAVSLPAANAGWTRTPKHKDQQRQIARDSAGGLVAPSLFTFLSDTLDAMTPPPRDSGSVHLGSERTAFAPQIEFPGTATVPNNHPAFRGLNISNSKIVSARPASSVSTRLPVPVSDMVSVENGGTQNDSAVRTMMATVKRLWPGGPMTDSPALVEASLADDNSDNREWGLTWNKAFDAADPPLAIVQPDGSQWLPPGTRPKIVDPRLANSKAKISASSGDSLFKRDTVESSKLLTVTDLALLCEDQTGVKRPVASVQPAPMKSALKKTPQAKSSSLDDGRKKKLSLQDYKKKKTEESVRGQMPSTPMLPVSTTTSLSQPPELVKPQAKPVDSFQSFTLLVPNASSDLNLSNTSEHTTNLAVAKGIQDNTSEAHKSEHHNSSSLTPENQNPNEDLKNSIDANKNPRTKSFSSEKKSSPDEQTAPNSEITEQPKVAVSDKKKMTAVSSQELNKRESVHPAGKALANLSDVESVQKVLSDVESVQKVLSDEESVQKVLSDVDSIQKVLNDVESVHKVLSDVESVQKMCSSSDNFDGTKSMPTDGSSEVSAIMSIEPAATEREKPQAAASSTRSRRFSNMCANLFTDRSSQQTSCANLNLRNLSIDKPSDSMSSELAELKSDIEESSMTSPKILFDDMKEDDHDENLLTVSLDDHEEDEDCNKIKIGSQQLRQITSPNKKLGSKTDGSEFFLSPSLQTAPEVPKVNGDMSVRSETFPLSLNASSENSKDSSPSSDIPGKSVHNASKHQSVQSSPDFACANLGQLTAGGKKSTKSRKRKHKDPKDKTEDTEYEALLRLSLGLRPGKVIQVGGLGKNPTDDPLPVLGDEKRKKGRQKASVAKENTKGVGKSSKKIFENNPPACQTTVSTVKKKRRNAGFKKKRKCRKPTGSKENEKEEEQENVMGIKSDESQDCFLSTTNENHASTVAVKTKDPDKRSNGIFGQALPLSSLGFSHWTEALVAPQLDPQVTLVDLFKVYRCMELRSDGGQPDFDNCAICRKVIDTAVLEEDTEEQAAAHTLSQDRASTYQPVIKTEPEEAVISCQESHQTVAEYAGLLSSATTEQNTNAVRPVESSQESPVTDGGCVIPEAAVGSVENSSGHTVLSTEKHENSGHAVLSTEEHEDSGHAVLSTEKHEDSGHAVLSTEKREDSGHAVLSTEKREDSGHAVLSTEKHEDSGHAVLSTEKLESGHTVLSPEMHLSDLTVTAATPDSEQAVRISDISYSLNGVKVSLPDFALDASVSDFVDGCDSKRQSKDSMSRKSNILEDHDGESTQILSVNGREASDAGKSDSNLNNSSHGNPSLLKKKDALEKKQDEKSVRKLLASKSETSVFVKKQGKSCAVSEKWKNWLQTQRKSSSESENSPVGKLLSKSDSRQNRPGQIQQLLERVESDSDISDDELISRAKEKYRFVDSEASSQMAESGYWLGIDDLRHLQKADGQTCPAVGKEDILQHSTKMSPTKLSRLVPESIKPCLEKMNLDLSAACPDASEMIPDTTAGYKPNDSNPIMLSISATSSQQLDKFAQMFKQATGVPVVRKTVIVEEDLIQQKEPQVEAVIAQKPTNKETILENSLDEIAIQHELAEAVTETQKHEQSDSCESVSRGMNHISSISDESTKKKLENSTYVTENDSSNAADNLCISDNYTFSNAINNFSKADYPSISNSCGPVSRNWDALRRPMLFGSRSYLKELDIPQNITSENKEIVKESSTQDTSCNNEPALDDTITSDRGSMALESNSKSEPQSMDPPCELTHSGESMACYEISCSVGDSFLSDAANLVNAISAFIGVPGEQNASNLCNLEGNDIVGMEEIKTQNGQSKKKQERAKEVKQDGSIAHPKITKDKRLESGNSSKQEQSTSILVSSSVPLTTLDMQGSLNKLLSEAKSCKTAAGDVLDNNDHRETHTEGTTSAVAEGLRQYDTEYVTGQPAEGNSSAVAESLRQNGTEYVTGQPAEGNSSAVAESLRQYDAEYVTGQPIWSGSSAHLPANPFSIHTPAAGISNAALHMSNQQLFMPRVLNQRMGINRLYTVVPQQTLSFPHSLCLYSGVLPSLTVNSVQPLPPGVENVDVAQSFPVTSDQHVMNSSQEGMFVQSVQSQKEKNVSMTETRSSVSDSSIYIESSKGSNTPVSVPSSSKSDAVKWFDEREAKGKKDIYDCFRDILDVNRKRYVQHFEKEPPTKRAFRSNSSDHQRKTNWDDSSDYSSDEGSRSSRGRFRSVSRDRSSDDDSRRYRGRFQSVLRERWSDNDSKRNSGRFRSYSRSRSSDEDSRRSRSRFRSVSRGRSSDEDHRKSRSRFRSVSRDRSRDEDYRRSRSRRSRNKFSSVSRSRSSDEDSRRSGSRFRSVSKDRSSDEDSRKSRGNLPDKKYYLDSTCERLRRRRDGSSDRHHYRNELPDLHHIRSESDGQTRNIANSPKQSLFRDDIYAKRRSQKKVSMEHSDSETKDKTSTFKNYADGSHMERRSGENQNCVPVSGKKRSSSCENTTRNKRTKLEINFNVAMASEVLLKNGDSSKAVNLKPASESETRVPEVTTLRKIENVKRSGDVGIAKVSCNAQGLPTTEKAVTSLRDKASDEKAETAGGDALTNLKKSQAKSLAPDVTEASLRPRKWDAKLLGGRQSDQDDDLNAYAHSLLEGTINTNVAVVSNNVSNLIQKSLSGFHKKASKNSVSLEKRVNQKETVSVPKVKKSNILDKKPLEYLLFAKQMITKKLQEEKEIEKKHQHIHLLSRVVDESILKQGNKSTTEVLSSKSLRSPISSEKINVKKLQAEEEIEKKQQHVITDTKTKAVSVLGPSHKAVSEAPSSSTSVECTESKEGGGKSNATAVSLIHTETIRKESPASKVPRITEAEIELFTKMICASASSKDVSAKSANQTSKRKFHDKESDESCAVKASKTPKPNSVGADWSLLLSKSGPNLHNRSFKDSSIISYDDVLASETNFECAEHETDLTKQSEAVCKQSIAKKRDIVSSANSSTVYRPFALSSINLKELDRRVNPDQTFQSKQSASDAPSPFVPSPTEALKSLVDCISTSLSGFVAPDIGTEHLQKDVPADQQQAVKVTSQPASDAAMSSHKDTAKLKQESVTTPVVKIILSQKETSLKPLVKDDEIQKPDRLCKSLKHDATCKMQDKLFDAGCIINKQSNKTDLHNLETAETEIAKSTSAQVSLLLDKTFSSETVQDTVITNVSSNADHTVLKENAVPGISVKTNQSTLVSPVPKTLDSKVDSVLSNTPGTHSATATSFVYRHENKQQSKVMPSISYPIPSVNVTGIHKVPVSCPTVTSSTQVARVQSVSDNVTEPLKCGWKSRPQHVTELLIPQQVAEVLSSKPVTESWTPQPIVESLTSQSVTELPTPQVADLLTVQPVAGLSTPQHFSELLMSQPVTRLVIPQQVSELSMPHRVTELSTDKQVPVISKGALPGIQKTIKVLSNKSSDVSNIASTKSSSSVPVLATPCVSKKAELPASKANMERLSVSKNHSLKTSSRQATPGTSKTAPNVAADTVANKVALTEGKASQEKITIKNQSLKTSNIEALPGTSKTAPNVAVDTVANKVALTEGKASLGKITIKNQSLNNSNDEALPGTSCSAPASTKLPSNTAIPAGVSCSVKDIPRLGIGLDKFPAEQVEIESRLIEGCWKLLLATKHHQNVTGLIQDGPNVQPFIRNSSTANSVLVCSALDFVLKDIQIFLDVTKRQCHGRANQKVPFELLLTEELSSLYNKDGVYLILQQAISPKSYIKLKKLKMDIQSSLNKCAALVHQNKSDALMDERRRLVTLRAERKSLLSAFTGSCSVQRHRKLQLLMQNYSACDSHIRTVLGEENVSRMLFFKANIEAIREHLCIVEDQRVKKT